jgi:hypothetical protein
MAGALGFVLWSAVALIFSAGTATAALLALPVAVGVTGFPTAFLAAGIAVLGFGTTESADFLVGI